MPRRIRKTHRIIAHVGVAVVTLRVPRLRHHRIRADEPPHLRQIVAGVHGDQAQVVVARIVVVVAGEAVVGDRRVAGWRGCRERAEGVVANVRVGHVDPARRAQGHQVAQVVGVGVVERARCAHFIRKET